MLNPILTGLVILSVFYPQPVSSITPNLPIVVQNLPIVATSTTENIKQRIKYYAELYGVSEITLLNITKCESNFNPKAVGDNGTSYGLVQIHLPSHPDITKIDATNVEFALDFLAHMLKNGKGSMWTCWRMN